MRHFSLVGWVCILCSGLAWGQNNDSRMPPPASTAAVTVRITAPEAPVPTSIGAQMSRNGGSLFKATINNIPDATRAELVRADPSKAALLATSFVAVPDPEAKVVKKHDLVTIIIREESEFSADGTSEQKKEADLDARLQEWIKLDPSNFAIQGGAQGDNPPSVKMSGVRNFKGEGKVDRTDTFTTRIAAEIVDVKPNGTFAVQARKMIKHDDEEAEYILTGVCRAADLTPDNTILSTQVFNLEILTNHKGAVKDTTNRGLVPRLLDFINPF
ncbi:MAG: flagellar basal body L-ring protein FlgH [Bacillota bacterium]